MGYLIQIDGEIREATADEAAAIETQRAAGDALEAAAQAKALTRAAVLNKLGLTADETAALLG